MKGIYLGIANMMRRDHEKRKLSTKNENEIRGREVIADHGRCVGERNRRGSRSSGTPGAFTALVGLHGFGFVLDSTTPSLVAHEGTVVAEALVTYRALEGVKYIMGDNMV